MTEEWLYQVRIKVSKKISDELRRKTPSNSSNKISLIATNFGTTPVCTFDAFRGYCAEAERNGVEGYPLYQWTKDTIENPSKKDKHSRSFAFYAGSAQVYDLKLARSLHDALVPLLEEGQIEDLSLIDSNPKNNPQPPQKDQVD